jgi:Ser/Thr protein kinase RdoA (MazF antagonist)
MTTEAWPRVARLDAPRVLARIADITGVVFVLEGPCPGGEVGAAFVRWPDGRRSVLTASRTGSAVLVDRARAAGVPTPRYELTARVDGVRVIVQERLPGSPPSTVDAAVVGQMLDISDCLAGLLADEPDPRPAELYLTRDGPGFCLHEPMAAYDDTTRRLLDDIHEIGAAGTHMIGDDLTHMDFHPGNVLVDDRGRLTAVIDWDGAVRGDRYFDLVGLRLTLAGRWPHLAGLVDERLALLTPRRHRAYWAHHALRIVDWAIRHHDAAAVRRWVAASRSSRP